MRRIAATLICFLSLAIIGHLDLPCYAQAVTDSVPQYDLTVRLLPDAHRLVATGTMRLPASSTPRAELRLIMSDLMREFRVEILEPAASAGLARLDW